MEWNYVEDKKLPEENTEVLISVGGKERVMIGYYFDKYGWSDNELISRAVYA